MIEITKMGDTNCNLELECGFCKEPVPLAMPFFSVILSTDSVDWNPPQNHIACEKCANKYENN